MQLIEAGYVREKGMEGSLLSQGVCSGRWCWTSVAYSPPLFVYNTLSCFSASIDWLRSCTASLYFAFLHRTKEGEDGAGWSSVGDERTLYTLHCMQISWCATDLKRDTATSLYVRASWRMASLTVGWSRDNLHWCMAWWKSSCARVKLPS